MRHVRSFALILLVGILAASSTSFASPRPWSQTFQSRADDALAQGHPGIAILNLERARLLSPNSVSIAGDLARARLAADLPSTEPIVAGTAAQLLRTDQWGKVALAGVTLFAGALMALVWKLSGRWAFLMLAALGVAVAAAGFRGTIAAEPPPNLAIVVQSDQPARVAPSPRAAVSFRLREGSLVRIERNHGRFSLISARWPAWLGLGRRRRHDPTEELRSRLEAGADGTE